MAYPRVYELLFAQATRIVSVTARPEATIVRLDGAICDDDVPDEFAARCVDGVLCAIVVPTILFHTTTILPWTVHGALSLTIQQTPDAGAS